MRTPAVVCLALLQITLWTASGAVTAKRLVDPAAGGRLRYQANPLGNTVPNFSRAGYGGGGVALPVLPVVRTLGPSGNEADDGVRIQAAMNAVAALPADNWLHVVGPLSRELPSRGLEREV